MDVDGDVKATAKNGSKKEAKEIIPEIDQRRVGGHDDGWEGRELRLRLCGCCCGGRGGLGRGQVIREDLVYAEDDVCEEQGALDWVAPPTTDAPCAEEYGCCNRNPDECGIDVSDLGEVRDTPEEVD